MKQTKERPAVIRDWPVTIHIAALAFAIALPVLAVAALAVWQLNVTNQEAIRARIIGSARALSLDLDRQMAALTTTLDVLSGSVLLRERNLAAFDRRARATIEKHDWYLVLSDSTGQQLINTLVPPGTPLPHVANMQGLRISIQTGKSYVSDLFTGAVAKRPIMTITMPIVEGNDTPFVLFLAFGPEQLALHFQTIGLEDNWIGTILDRKGVIIARSAGHQRWLGKQDSAVANSSEMQAVEGIHVVHNVEGMRVLRAWHRSSTGLISIVSVPTELLKSQSRQIWLRFALGALLLLAVAGLLAYVFGSELAKPIRSLSRFAGRGGEAAFEPTRLREANEVAAALRESARKLLSSEGRYRTLAERARDIVLVIRDDGAIADANPAALNAYGYARDELIGMPIAALRDASELPQVQDQLAQAKQGGARFEAIHRRKDGTTFPVEVSAASAQVGAERLIYSIIRDITERKKAEEALKRDADHIHLLMRELSHRSKNLLAVIQAMARQTSRSAESLPEFEDRFEARIAALARSHDLLVHQNWEGVRLSDLVQTQLAPFVEDFDKRVLVKGAPLRLQPEAAHNIGLALHELATNASKYGALSSATGRIEIGWEILRPENAPPRFAFSWHETGGPAVVAPKRKGFGRQVIERLVPAALSGDAVLTFGPKGVAWTLQAPADPIVVAST